MASRLKIDHASVEDNDVAGQIEFTGELHDDEYEFAVRYAVLKELSGDEPEDDAVELFERFSDEIIDICVDMATKGPATGVIVVTEADLE
jgi:hypothetical protein